MIINDLNINVGDVDLKNIDLVFSSPGVYIVSGDNGCGKTSLIRAIISNSNQSLCFENAELDAEYMKNPGSLIAYVPQTLNRYSCSVEDYLIKECTNIDNTFAEELFLHFGMSYLDKNQNISTVSEGELTKLSLIAAFLKQTPYVFLDEPTNHLDNEGVRQLVNLIDSVKNEKTLVIVSHDERLTDKYNYRITIEGNRVIQNRADMDLFYLDTVRCPSSIRFHPWKQSLKGLCSKYNIVCVILVIMAFSFFLTYNTLLYADNYSHDNGKYRSDIIHTYKAEYEYSTTNRLYTKAEGIDVANNNTHRYIECKDIYKILKDTDVKTIIAFDNDQFYNSIENEKPLSIPRFFIDEYQSMYTGTSAGVGKLIVGDYPRDHRKEICIPKDKAEKMFGIARKGMKSSLKKAIAYNADTYTLSGYTTGQNILLSYNGKNISGFFDLSADNMNHLIDVYGSKKPAPGLFLFTKKGRERKTLNALIADYPAENYISKVFSDVWERSYNRAFILKKVFPINLIISVLFCIIIAIIRKYQSEANRGFIRDYNAHYLRCDHFIFCNRFLLALLSLLIFLLILTVNHLMSDAAWHLDKILILDFVIINLPIILSLLTKGKKDVP